MADIENEIKKYLDTIWQNYSKFLLCYNLFQLSAKSRAPNVIWLEQADKNIKIINKYNSIFIWLEQLKNLAIIELHKIFEKQNKRYNNTISLITFIDFLKENKNEINICIKGKFDNHCNKLKESQLNFLSVEEIKTEEWWQKELDDEFFIIIKQKILIIEHKFEHLKEIRHSIWHNIDKDKKKIKKLKVSNFTDEDIDNFKEIFFEIFNIINSYLWNWVYDYNFFYKETERDYNLLLRNLKEFYEIRSLFFDNYLNKQWKTDEDIMKEIKSILKIDF